MTTDFDKLISVGTSFRPIKIGVLDIETTDLKANDGYMLCACVKEVNKDNLKGKIHAVSITDLHSRSWFDDEYICQELVDILDSFDLIVTWYGSGFDHRFINTRCLKYSIVPPKRNFRRDLCFVARGIGALKNNRLATWGNFLYGKSGKTFLPWSTWIDAIRGKKEAIDKIVYHCKQDVIETEKIYKRFMPLLGKLRRG